MKKGGSMKIRLLTRFGWIFLALAMPVGATAQTYTVTDLGPIGKPPGQPFVIANNGLVSGAATASNGAVHAMLWYKHLRGDIGVPGLGGRNSVAFGVNSKGQAVGEAETTLKDPNGEDFCGFKTMGFTSSGRCLPFFWEDGIMHRLPTLGGYNGVANEINRYGTAVGLAENSTPDPACPAPQVLHFKPVEWKQGRIQELPTFNGDPDGLAYGLNDKGQVVGGSGVCGPFSLQLYVSLQSLHALLWENGKVTNLGTLGGDGHGFGIIAQNINSYGEVVGNSDLAGDTSFHGFLWTRAKGMRDLGTLPGDVNSSAVGINDAGEIVGISLDKDFNGRAFIRRNGHMFDLNTLVTDSHLHLILGCSINASGQITGLAVDSEGVFHGYVATPTY
jgi:probable HAF family extracellular repeat protein